MKCWAILFCIVFEKMCRAEKRVLLFRGLCCEINVRCAVLCCVLLVKKR